MDDGLTWTTVYTTMADDYPGATGLAQMAVAPRDPRFVAVAASLAHGDGDLLESRDGGHTWLAPRYSPTQTLLQALAFNPLSASDLWVTWGWGGSILEHNGVTVLQTINSNTMTQLSGALVGDGISDLWIGRVGHRVAAPTHGHRATYPHWRDNLAGDAMRAAGVPVL